MKKLLLTLVAAVVALCAGAQTTIDANKLTVPGVTTVDGYTFDVQKQNGSSAPQVYQGQALRVYMKNTVTISAKKLTKIVFNLNESTSKRLADFTPSVGKLEPAQAAGDTQITWVGDAETVTFTVGDKAVYGTDGDTKAGQVHIDSFTIEGEAAEVVEEPTDNNILFQDDFEWLEPWSSIAPAGQTVETNNPGAKAQQLATNKVEIDGTQVSTYDALLAKGYDFLAVCKEGSEARAASAQTYLQRNYIKFGLTDYYSGIVLPKLVDVPAEGYDAKLSFDWCSMRQGSGKWDATELVVIVKNGDDEQQFLVPTYFYEDNQVYSWTSTEVVLAGATITPDTRIIVRNIDAQWPAAGGAYRWFIDNIVIEAVEATVNAGTEEAPLTAAEATALAQTLDASGAIENAYVAGKILSITEVSTQYGNATFTIGDENASFSIFRAKWLNNEKFTDENAIRVGGTIVLTGKIVNYQGNTPQLSTGYVVKYDASTEEEPTTPQPGEGYTIEATSLTIPGTTTADGYTVVIDKSTGGTAPAFNNGTKALRLYASNTLTVSAKNLTKITFTLASDAAARYTSFTPSTGELSPAQAAGDTEITWVGNAESVTFTVGEKATMGTDGETAAGQIRMTAITIEGTPGTGETPEPPTVEYDGYLNENDANGAEGWTFNDGTLPEGVTYVWSWKAYSGKYYLNASAYVGGAAYATDAWAISPVIDLTGATNPSFAFDQAAKFQTTLKDLCYVAVREEGATEWTKLPLANWPEANTWNFSTSGEISLADFTGKKVQLGFHYGSSTTGADTWEIKNLKVNGLADSTAITEIDANAPVEYFNLQGIRIANPENGIFIRRQGNSVSKVIIR